MNKIYKSKNKTIFNILIEFRSSSREIFKPMKLSNFIKNNEISSENSNSSKNNYLSGEI